MLHRLPCRVVAIRLALAPADTENLVATVHQAGHKVGAHVPRATDVRTIAAELTSPPPVSRGRFIGTSTAWTTRPRTVSSESRSMCSLPWAPAKPSYYRVLLNNSPSLRKGVAAEIVGQH